MSFYLSRVRLTDVRGFKELDLAFGTPAKPRMWTVVIGNNGHGKSALLRAIALGLCDEKTASALLTALSGDFIRRNMRGNPQPEARIELELTSGGKRPQTHRLVTVVSRDENGQEKVRSQLPPASTAGRSSRAAMASTAAPAAPRYASATRSTTGSARSSTIT